MKLQVSEKVAGSFGKRPKIKKGYYPGKLMQVKPRQDKDGNWVESKFGRQIILLFQVLDQNMKPIKNPENQEEDLVLGQVLNSEYRQEDGTYRTAVTANSRITKVFEAIGWKFSTDGVDTDSLIGSVVELNIDDYEVTDNDGTKYKASSIKDINKWEGETPTQSQPELKKESVKEEKVENPKVQQLRKLHADGMLSEEGLKKALEQLENE